MQSSTLKNEIMTMLEGMEDESVLRVVHNILGQNKAVYRLNDEQIRAVREADEQYARGEAISDDEAEREVWEWQKNIVRERMAEYKADPSIAIPWDDVKDSFDLDAK